jgi:hypothetical protein
VGDLVPSLVAAPTATAAVDFVVVAVAAAVAAADEVDVVDGVVVMAAVAVDHPLPLLHH